MKKSSFSLIVDKWTGKLKASSVFSLGEWGCLYFRFIHWGCFGGGCFGGEVVFEGKLTEGGCFGEASKGLAGVIEKRVGVWCVRGERLAHSYLIFGDGGNGKDERQDC
ncbi:hypothetical protein MNL11_07030 [Bartonella krasnovii]|uniref:hypothetical protein n=1 Tax=Bartonella krasnovii TaxID=2267275 RepID=UPI001F4C6088|nr:hypothetical protein [Bartonella krasnovii]UNF36825.1 hypothetical protein MNL11_07030 [Bartonella krasnovii]